MRATEKLQRGRVTREEATSTAETLELAARGQGGHTEVRASRQSWGRQWVGSGSRQGPSPWCVGLWKGLHWGDLTLVPLEEGHPGRP